MEKKNEIKVAEKKATEMQQEIEKKTQELQKCLAVLNRKKELSDNRTAFIKALDLLDIAEEKLNEEGDFESQVFRLSFSETYQREDIFRISNKAILKEFVCFIREKIHAKIADIEGELIS